MRLLKGYGLNAMEVVEVRALVTTVCLGLFLVIKKPSLFRIHWKDLWCFVGNGCLSIVFFNFCYFKAISLTSLSVAAILLYTAPAMVILMSYWFFKEAINRKKILALVMTFAGCCLVSGLQVEAGLSMEGILLGLGAGLGYALYSIFSRCALMRGYHSLTITFYTFLFAAVGAAALCDFSVLRQAANQGILPLGISLGMGLLGTVVPYLVYTLGLSYIENGKASILATIEPITATLYGVLLYHEQLTWQSTLGIVLVLVGVFLCSGGKKAEESEISSI